MFSKSVSGLKTVKATSIEVATKGEPINIHEGGISIPELQEHGGKIPIKFGNTDFHVGHLSDDPNNEYIYLNSLSVENTGNNVQLELDPVEPIGRQLQAKIPGDLVLTENSKILIGSTQIASANLVDDANILKSNQNDIIHGSLEIDNTLVVKDNITTTGQYQISQNGVDRQINTTDLENGGDLVFSVKTGTNALTENGLVMSKNVNGLVSLENKTLEKNDLAGITDLVYKSDTFENSKIVKTDDQGELVTSTISTDDLTDKTDLFFVSDTLTDGKIVKSKITVDGQNQITKLELTDKDLEKSDLSQIVDLVYKSDTFENLKIVKTDDQGELVTATISTTDLTDNVDLIFPVKDENSTVILTDGKLVKSKITLDEQTNEITKLELEDKDLEKSDLSGITDLVYKAEGFTANSPLVSADADGNLISGTLASSDLSDGASLVKTDDNRLINLSNHDKLVKVNNNGQLEYVTISVSATGNEVVNADGLLPAGTMVVTGHQVTVTASPAAPCLFNSHGEINAYPFTHNIYLESIMGFSSVDKTDTYGQGLVARGNATHNSEFLRKDGSWAIPSVHTGSVSENLRSLDDFPNDYTGHQGKYLKVDDDANYPLGTGVVFTSIGDDIQDYINSGDLTGLTVNGQIQAQSFLSVSDKRLKRDIKKLQSEESLDLLKKIEPVTYQFKDDKENRTKFGILAQQIQRVMPDSVIDCGGTLKVEMLDLLGVLLGAVKGLSDEVAQLKQKI